MKVSLNSSKKLCQKEAQNWGKPRLNVCVDLRICLNLKPSVIVALCLGFCHRHRSPEDEDDDEEEEGEEFVVAETFHLDCLLLCVVLFFIITEETLQWKKT